MKNINLLVIFVLELGVLYSVGYWGFHLLAPLPVRILAMIAAPLAMAALWWFFGAPNAAFGFHGWGRVAFEAGWFGLGAVALAAVGRISWAVVVAVVTVISKILAVNWER